MKAMGIFTGVCYNNIVFSCSEILNDL